MSDKRKNNGGHSTVAKGKDKRKNVYKDALEVLSIDKLKEVLEMLHKKATTEDDTAAGKILLEWYLSKPKQEVDLNAKVEAVNLINLGTGNNPDETTA